MAREHRGTNIERSEFYGALQRIVDTLFLDAEAAAASSGGVGSGVDEDQVSVRRLEVVIAAEAADLPDDLMRIVNLLPPGSYTRQRLCDQINSAITGHAWGQVYGTVS